MGKNSKINVLLTGAGAPGARGIIRCLRNNGEHDIKLIGVDMREDVPFANMLDGFYQIPPAKDDNFINAILDICIKEDIQFVLPIITRELEKFSASVDLFSKHGIKVAVMEYDNLCLVNNKAKLLEALTNKGVECPKFVVANTVEEIKQGCDKMGYPNNPVCVKRTFGNGSRGVRILDESVSKYDLFFNEKPNSMITTYSNIIDTLSEKPTIPEMMVMEYLPGEEYSVDILADKGEIIYMVGRTNTVVISSIPQESVLIVDEKAYEMSKKIVKALNLSGNVGIDFRMNKDNEPRIMEINPRLTATIVLNAVAGINFPYLTLKYYMGEKMPELNIKYGTKVKKKTIEEFYDNEGNSIEF